MMKEGKESARERGLDEDGLAPLSAPQRPSASFPGSSQRPATEAFQAAGAKTEADEEQGNLKSTHSRGIDFEDDAASLAAPRRTGTSEYGSESGSVHGVAGVSHEYGQDSKAYAARSTDTGDEEQGKLDSYVEKMRKEKEKALTDRKPKGMPAKKGVETEDEVSTLLASQKSANRNGSRGNATAAIAGGSIALAAAAAAAAPPNVRPGQLQEPRSGASPGNNEQTVVAQAVTNEDLANEIREELRSEIRQEVEALQGTPVSAEPLHLSDGAKKTTEDQTPFWKRKCFIVVAIILVLAAIGGIVGGVVAGSSNDGGGEKGLAAVPTVSPTKAPTMTPTTAPPTATPTTGPPTMSPTTSAPTTTPFPTFTPAALTVLQTVPGIDERGRFGVDCKLSRDGTTLAVGAINRSTVIVYRRNGNQWVRLGQVLKGSGSFGGRIDLSESGNTIVIGARSNDDGGEEAGQVRVFRFSTDSWVPQGSPINGRAAEDQFGFDVSISDSGRTIAVTSRLGDPSPDRMNAGYAQIFTFSGDWVQLGNDIEGELALDQFGRTISLDSTGRRVAVGATIAAGGNGQVRVFDFDGSAWNQVGQNLDGEAFEDSQGTSVTFSEDGSILAVGADGSARNGSGAGMVRVYQLVEGTWIQRGQSMLGEGPFGNFGATHLSLTNDGNLLAVGAQNLNEELGAAYLYRYNVETARWSLVARVEGDGPGEDFGECVSLSGDGQFFAVGAPDIGVGYVRVFQVE